MSNHDMDLEVFQYVEELRGANSENAFFALLHLEDKHLPSLINAYHQQSDLAIKATLVEVIWQHRQPELLPFLHEAFHHQYEDIWKNALDGIVTIGGAESLTLLEIEKNWLFANPLAAPNRLEWVDEAISQIKTNLD